MRPLSIDPPTLSSLLSMSIRLVEARWAFLLSLCPPVMMTVFPSLGYNHTNGEFDYHLHLAQAWPALPWTRLGQVCQEPVSLSYSEIRLVSSQPPISRNFVAEMATAQESKVIPGKEGPASHLVAPVGRKEEEEE